MKERLLRGEASIGCSLMFPSIQMVEMFGALGFDWVLIDCEHGSIGINDLDALIAAAEGAGLSTVVRPESNDPVAIGRILDRGAQGLQIPHVSTADDARRAVAAARYLPQGERGLAGGTRASNYGIGFKPADFVTRSNENVLVCVQIEHREALDHLDELVKIEGVDVFFVGPTDMSLSLGHPGNFDEPVVRQALERCYAAIRAAGKVAGTSGSGALLRDFRSLGARYMYTQFQGILTEGRDRFRALLGD
ncbi:MAG: 2-dehydro-3-deoxyglucarate aldolase [Candidatus Eremiobacteraeota bacterium]|nr:2-dehydro-3-deoxyglucarate aldolase [Candidatus Eremiobacteraeota bacterium]